MAVPLEVIIPLFMLACNALAKATITTNVSEPCHYFDTVPINPNNAQTNNQTGAIVYNNITYNVGQFGWYDYNYTKGVRQPADKHLRGCMCAINGGTCIRLCNEFGEVFHSRQKVKHNETTYKVYVNISGDSRVEAFDLANDEHYKHRLIHGPTCENRFLAEPDMYEFREVKYNYI
jgi:hypothetical protein